jgi:Zn-dependent protease
MRPNFAVTSSIVNSVIGLSLAFWDLFGLGKGQVGISFLTPGHGFFVMLEPLNVAKNTYFHQKPMLIRKHK